MADYCGTGSGNFPQPGDPDLNNSSINAVPAFGGIDVSWSYPELNPEAVAHTILYRSTNEDPETRVRHRIVQGDYFYDRINNENPITYYYWIQHVSVNGTVGDLIGPDSAQARPTIEQTIEMLTGQIDNGVLATELKGEIGRLDTLESDLLTEKTNRINSDDTISDAFSDLEVNVANAETLIQNEVLERQTADANQVDSINTLFAQMDDNSAAIQQESSVRASEDSALAESINTLQTKTDDNTAEINQEKKTRTDEDEALAQQIDSVAAASANIFRRDTPPDPSNETINDKDIWIDPSNGNRLSQWNGSEWVDAQDSGIQAAYSAVQSEENARVEEDNALGKRIDTVVASVNDNEAAIQTEQKARADEDSALATRVNTLESDTADNSAAISEESTARADEDSALGSRIDSVVASSVHVFRKETAPDPANTDINLDDLWVDTANGNRLHQWDGSQWVDSQDADISGAFAAIQSEETARIKADEATATKVSTLESTLTQKAETFFQAKQPTASNPGDLWIKTDDSNKLFRWNGTSWVDIHNREIDTALQDAASAQSTADSKIDSFWQSTEPTASGVGDIWFDTADQNHPYRWNGTSWEDARDDKIADALQDAATAQSTADGKVTTFYSSTAPTAEGVGDLWVNTGDKNKLTRWDGSAWVSIRDSDIAVGVSRNQVFRQAEPPVADNVNDIWFDSDNGDKAHQWDGSDWTPVNLSTTTEVTAAIESEETTRTNEDQALAEKINTAQTNLGNDIASVETTLNTEIKDVNEEVTNIGALYTAKVDVNGLVGGFGVYNDGSEVEAGFDVDRFWVGRTGNDKRKPFIVEGEEVFIDEAAINKLQFNKLRADDSSVVVENGKLKANYIDAQNLYLDYGNIQNVDIQWADINNVSIGSADIDTAAVDTLEIRGRAVTVPTKSNGSGSITGSSWGGNAAKFVFNHEESENVPVVFTISVFGRANAHTSQGTFKTVWKYRLVVDGSVEFTSDWIESENASNSTYDKPTHKSSIILINISPGDKNVYVDAKAQVSGSSGSVSATIIATGYKR